MQETLRDVRGPDFFSEHDYKVFLYILISFLRFFFLNCDCLGFFLTFWAISEKILTVTLFLSFLPSVCIRLKAGFFYSLTRVAERI